MIVLLVAFISLCSSISGSKICASSPQYINTSGPIIEILYPCNNTIEAVAGSKLEITCSILAEPHTVEILVYWLANHTFIEDYSRSKRVTETQTKRRGTEKSYLEDTLNFSEVERKDFEITFACVMLSGGIYQARYISIKPAVSNVGSHIAIAVAVVISIILISVCMYKLLKFKPPLTYVNLN